MAEYYVIPDNPQFSLDHIRRIQNSDPVNAETIVNPLIQAILENLAALKRQSVQIAVSALPPASGPALWLCSDPAWRPETVVVATALLGNPDDADRADAQAVVNGTRYPVTNAATAMEGGTVVTTIHGTA